MIGNLAAAVFWVAFAAVLIAAHRSTRPVPPPVSGPRSAP